MDERILQINFKLNVPRADFEAAARSLAQEYAEVDGLRWKIWLMNEKENEAGGIYVFDNEASLGAFLSGSLAKKVSEHPAVKNMSVKQFNYLPDVTAVTRGPIDIRTPHTT
jgi:hypothetical protein